MSDIRANLEKRRNELTAALKELKPLQDELEEVNTLLGFYERNDVKRVKGKKTCSGCYYVPRDSRDGPPLGGCDECRQGPNYR